MLKTFFHYFDPLAHLGEARYGIVFPGVVMFLIIFLSEFYAYNIAGDPMAVGRYAIFLFMALTIYFAFRSGVKGGVTATVLTVFYYLYIIYSRRYEGSLLTAGISMTFYYGLLQLLIGGIIGWLKQMIDLKIVEEKDEKNRLQTILDQLPVGVVVTTPAGEVVRANNAIATILGSAIPIGFRVGKDDHLVSGSKNGQKVAKSNSPLARTIIANTPIAGEEITIKRPDKSVSVVKVNTSPIENTKGKVIAFASIIQDITLQKELETRKDDFVNMASHELKTPLTSLKLYLEVLSRTGNNAHKKTHILSKLNQQTARIQDLVDDLLDVSRLNTGKLQLHKEKFNLNELIAETVQELQATAAQELVFHHPNKAFVVKADRFRIFQVVTNLLTNAIKYSKAEKPIEVYIHGNDGVVEVKVVDHGIGIDKAEQKKIFERLYQVSDRVERTYPGLGMGLYISKEIINRHKGKIWVESTKGKGSTFYFRLPANSDT